jgi:hypothetical protein
MRPIDEAEKAACTAANIKFCECGGFIKEFTHGPKVCTECGKEQ